MYPNPYEQNPYEQRQAGSGGNGNLQQNPPSGPNPYGPPNNQPTVYGSPSNPGQYAPPPPPSPSNPQWDRTVRADDPSQYPSVPAPTSPQYPQQGQFPSNPQYPQQGQFSSSPNQYAAPTTPNQFTPNQYQQPTAQYQGAGTFSPPPTQPKKSSNLRIILIALAAIIVIGGGLATFFAVSAHNTQVANDNATATARVNSTNTAVAQANASATANARATATANAQATATAIASTYPFSTNVKLDDPMADNSKGAGWKTSSACSFTGGTYHVKVQTSSTYDTCPASSTNFTNFTYQVTMQINSGDYGGITFRGNDASSHFYAFAVNTDGTYYIELYTASSNPKELGTDFTSAFNTGAGASNTIGVVAKGSTMTFYVNNQQVTSVTNSTLTGGQVGVIGYDVSNTADVAFSNAKVWDLTGTSNA